MRCRRLADVTVAPALIFLCGRPQRKVVGKRRQRSHVHEVVAQQAIASTQVPVDYWQEEVSALRRGPEICHHVVNLDAIPRRVVVSADTEYVSSQSRIRHEYV